MALTTEKNGQIKTAAPVPQGDRVQWLMSKLEPAIKLALPRHLTPDRLSRIVTTALRAGPAYPGANTLLDCEPMTIMACVMQLAQLGLEPNTLSGHAYLIARNNRKANIVECSVMIGYRGYIELARRAGTSIYATAVHEGDHFRYSRGLVDVLEHTPSDDPARMSHPVTHAWARGRIRGQVEPEFEVLNFAQIEARRLRGASGMKKSTPWDTDYDAMAAKSAVRALVKFLPQSAEMMHAETIDVTSESGRSVAALLDDRMRTGLLGMGVAVPSESLDADGETVDADTGEVTPAKGTETPFD